MRVIYDEAIDTLSVVLRERPVADSDEEKPGVILDCDEEGQIVAFEILDASYKVGDPRNVEFTTAG